MSWKHEWKWLAAMVVVFLAAYFVPVGGIRFDRAILEGVHLLKGYAREHVLLCLVPAFFIAGGISVFVSQASVLKYLGANANKTLAYGVASVSGSVLAVCSCTVLPLFAGIYRMGAGIGPASAFLYAGPAINVLAIVLTARVLGLEMGLARAGGAVAFSILIGLAMHALFRDEEQSRAARAAAIPVTPAARSLPQETAFFASMIGILVFANWARPPDAGAWWQAVYDARWLLTAACAIALTAALAAWFRRDEMAEWLVATWTFAKQILPLLFVGVFVAGVLLGRPGQEGLIPSAWVSGLVGGNSVGANFFAAIVGAFMYFATLTEVPILQGLIGAGMGKGPALALLLAGPALSLPSMIVLKGILGVRKTIAYVTLVVLMATISGAMYGAVFGG